MTGADRTAALVLRWVAVYTRSLDPEVAARRQAELASDLWEQRAHAGRVGAPGPLVALSILRRAVAGVPADLLWRRHQLAAARGRPPVPRRWPVASTRTRALARTWWLVLAALLVPLDVLGAFGIMGFDTSTDPWWPKLWSTGALVMIVAAVLIAAGILARRWARATGDVLVAVGALPLTISLSQLDANLPRVVAAATLLVTVMAVLDAADAASLAGRVGGAHRRPLALATAAAAAVAGLGLARADAAPAVVLSTMAGSALLATLAVAGYRQRRRIS
jgi:uncharacterized membrane protein YgdD (TMEM256/DUF423 family)